MTGCTYCAYQGVCGFDTRLDGYKMNNITISAEETMEKIMAEES